jgi:hypothetical protein
MADLYDSLAAVDQANVRAKLLAIVQSKPCPDVDVSAVTSADSLNDAANRAMAIDCFQHSRNDLTYSTTGELDGPTLRALVGFWPSLTPTQKILTVTAVGAAGAGVYWLATRRRRRR